MTTAPSNTDRRLEFSALERTVLEWLSVPADPEIPDGSTSSVHVFRAGANYYTWLVIVWAAQTLFTGAWLSVITFAATRSLARASELGAIAIATVLTAGWAFYIGVAVITFLSRRLNFRMRWYVVTDRSLRIRSGIFSLTELTMTYRNVQEIRVTAGLLENAMGLATVEVHAAGGGGGDPRRGGARGHVGKLAGLSNANEIRDLLIERLRQYRDAGLGETLPSAAVASDDTSAIEAAREVLAEARALKRAIAAPR